MQLAEKEKNTEWELLGAERDFHGYKATGRKGIDQQRKDLSDCALPVYC